MGCCHIDQASGKLIVQEVVREDETYHLFGSYDRAPKTLSDRINRWFQRSELAEKVAEIVDEGFHVGKETLKWCTTAELYQTFRELHQAAHSIEHVLHAFCFLGDLLRLATGQFFEYEGKEENRHLNYLRSAARVCHTVDHFLTTVTFLSHLKLCQLGRFERVVKYTSAFSALGYGIWMISLIWQRQQGVKNENFMSDVEISLGGCLFKVLPLITAKASQVSSLAGIIHASCLVQRLLPIDNEKVTSSFETISLHHDVHPHDDLT